MEFEDPISVIRISYNGEGEIFLFDNARQAAENIQDCLDYALRLTDLGPSYFGKVDCTIEIVEMERAEFEELEEL